VLRQQEPGGELKKGREMGKKEGKTARRERREKRGDRTRTTPTNKQMNETTTQQPQPVKTITSTSPGPP
jgi:hypothetical protein